MLHGHIFVNIAQNVCHTADFDTDFCASTSFVIFFELCNSEGFIFDFYLN